MQKSSCSYCQPRNCTCQSSMIYCTCRAKVDLPLVSPGQFNAPSQQDTLCKTREQASARIADKEQPYLANVPLLQHSYLFAGADWYSLVTTLLSSHWDTICSAYSPATQTADAINKAPPASNQDLGSDWMSWGWLQGFFKGLNAQNRQVLRHCLHNIAASIYHAGSVLSCFCFKQASPLLPEKPITPQTANDTSIAQDSCWT